VHRITQARAPTSYLLPSRKPNARLCDCLFLTISSKVVNEGCRAVVYTLGTDHTSRLFGILISRGLVTVTMKSAKDGASTNSSISDHECALIIPLSWVAKFLHTSKLGYLWKTPENRDAQNRPLVEVYWLWQWSLPRTAPVRIPTYPTMNAHLSYPWVGLQNFFILRN